MVELGESQLQLTDGFKKRVQPSSLNYLWDAALSLEAADCLDGIKCRCN